MLISALARAARVFCPAESEPTRYYTAPEGYGKDLVAQNGGTKQADVTQGRPSAPAPDVKQGGVAQSGDVKQGRPSASLPDVKQNGGVKQNDAKQK